LLHTDGADHAWNPSSASCFPVVNDWHDRNDAINIRGTDDIGDLFYVCKWKHGPTHADAVRTTSFIIHVRLSGFDDTGATAARNTSSVVAFHYCSSSDLIDYDNVTDRDNTSGAVGHHSHANRDHHDRECRAHAPAWQCRDYRVQLYTGRSADQWRGFAAHDA
jgi:hypothetical protein